MGRAGRFPWVDALGRLAARLPWRRQRGRRLVQAAQRARDAGQWEEALALFDRAAACQPDRPVIRLQIGNCAKEAGLFRRAHDAYASALGTERGREAEVQIGHLFKVTGNFRAALEAFERARALGDPSAAQECDSYGSGWIKATRVSRMAAEGERGLHADELTTLLALAIDGAPISATCRTLGEQALALGERHLAKAFFELGFLASPERTKWSEALDLAARTGLWATSRIPGPARAEGADPSREGSDIGGRLRALVAAALSGHDDDAGDTPPVKDFPAPPSRPAPLDDQSSVDIRARVASAIAVAFEAVCQHDGSDPSAAIAAISALRSELRGVPRVVALATSCTIESYRLHATRTLRDLAADWIDQVEEAWLGPRARPGLIAALLSPAGNPVAERLAKKATPAALFDEIEATLDALGVPAVSHDRIMARLLAAVAAGLSLAEVRSLVAEALRRGLSATGVALLERQMASGRANRLEIALRLRQAGQERRARALLDQGREGGSAVERLQRAIFAKACGGLATAARLLEDAIAEFPESEELRRELIDVLPELEPVDDILARFQGDTLFLRLAGERLAYRRRMSPPDADREIGISLAGEDVRVVDLAPEVATEFLPSRTVAEREGIRPIRIGWMTKPGPAVGQVLPLLRRHDFVRVQTAFREPIERLRVRINGCDVGLTDGVALPTETSSGLCHEMFNCWIDLSGVPEGLHELQLRFEGAGGGWRTHVQSVWVDPTPPSDEALVSAATVDLSGDEAPGSIEERIARQPSAEFRGARRLLAPPRRILVMRVDQLGDLVTSIPSMLRLREHFPGAELTCLVSPNYVPLVRELGIFAEILSLDFPYEQTVGMRHTTLAKQAELRRLLGARRFDVAIDLCFGHMTRPLLRLAQARFTAGFWPQEFGWLDFGIDVRSRDVVNGRYRLPQQVLSNMLVDGLAALVTHTAIHLPRAEMEWEALKALGVTPDTRFVMIHVGGRTLSRRWPVPHFVRLAEIVATQMNVPVLVVGDDPTDFGDADRRRLEAAGVPLILERLALPVLDSLLSACTVFVGNDSGPKHLAAFRGVPVVSVHGGALNWSEWGQDGVGRIITHRVPCSGCGIELVEECGKGLACLRYVTPETVLNAVREEFRQRAGACGD